jgi:hypothetical protein
MRHHLGDEIQIVERQFAQHKPVGFENDSHVEQPIQCRDTKCAEKRRVVEFRSAPLCVLCVSAFK